MSLPSITEFDCTRQDDEKAYRDSQLEEVLKQFSKWRLTGSTVIDPDGHHNDTDYVCLFVPSVESLWPELDGFDPLGGSNPEKYLGVVYRLCTDCHGIDLIITEDEDHYEKIVLATEVCTELKLTNREDRIMIFHAVAYGTRKGSLEPCEIEFDDIFKM